MLKPPIRILIVAALCVAGLIGLVVREGMARDSGREITMAMAALDPRALLSGHYVIVDLRNPLPRGANCPVAPEDAEWIALAPEGEHHRVVGAAPTRQQALALGPLAARGALTCLPPAPDANQPGAFPGWIGADLGINRFYASQSEAERIERVIREQSATDDTRVYAVISVGADGRARLSGLIVDDQRLDLSWF
jgi:hypothetical protein